MPSRLEENRISLRYARALFEKADAEGQVESILQDLKAVQEVFQQVPDLSGFFANPAISLNDKFEIIQAQFAEGLSSWVTNLLKLLVSHERIGVFVSLVDHYQDMVDEKNNVATAEIITAVVLEEDMLNKIRRVLEQLYGFREVRLQRQVNPEILGGVIIKIQDKILDGSYTSRLEALRQLA